MVPMLRSCCALGTPSHPLMPAPPLCNGSVATPPSRHTPPPPPITHHGPSFLTLFTQTRRSLWSASTRPSRRAGRNWRMGMLPSARWAGPGASPLLSPSQELALLATIGCGGGLVGGTGGFAILQGGLLSRLWHRRFWGRACGRCRGRGRGVRVRALLQAGQALGLHVQGMPFLGL